MQIQLHLRRNADGRFVCSFEQYDFWEEADTAEAAYRNLVLFRQDIIDFFLEGGCDYYSLSFTVNYDVPSFFSRYNYINITKFAVLAGINPSLMRQYASGLTKPGPQQCDKIEHAIRIICMDMQGIHIE